LARQTEGARAYRRGPTAWRGALSASDTLESSGRLCLALAPLLAGCRGTVGGGRAVPLRQRPATHGADSAGACRPAAENRRTATGRTLGGRGTQA